MSIATIKSYWDIMQPEDAHVVILSFLATLVLGGAMVGGFVWYAMRLDAQNTRARIEKEDARIDTVLAERAARQGRTYVPPSGQKSITQRTAPSSNAASKAAAGPKAARSQLPAPAEKRHIPVESQTLLIQKGREQLAEDRPDKALVTYLTLLYSAAENRDGSALPASLTECLRGAAECYRKLGQPENAVKFLQAERRVFEEVVVSAANAGKEKSTGGKAGGILETLLNPNAKAQSEEDLPRRCQTLSTVAEACTKLGRHDVALAYRVKAAAVSQKVTGKPLDETSPEMVAMAAALAKVRDMGMGTDKIMKEATSGENAVRHDDPLLLQMLKNRGMLSPNATEVPSGLTEGIARPPLGASAGPPSESPLGDIDS